MRADPSQDHILGPLGPAVSPRSAAVNPGFASPDEPLAPFPPRPATATTATPAPEPAPEPALTPQEQPEPAPAPGFDDLPWLYLADEERVVEPEPDAPVEEMIEPVAGLEPTSAPPEANALSRVADRLEAIARSLRERDPADLALDPADPLQLLITGYALGLAEASDRAGGGRE